MVISHLLGNERFKAALAPLFRENFPQAVLLEGDAGLGKKTAAFAIASGLLCTGPQPPCGVCGPCRRMAAGSHPDYKLFNPQGETIKVDDVRDIRRQSFIRPSEGEQKVFVINAAHLMTVQAQNALLKVLEEPQATVFLLLCHRGEQLLQTVRSRCVRFALEPLGDALLDHELSARHPAAEQSKRELALARAAGSLGRALQALEGGESKAAQLAQGFTQALTRSELSVLESCLAAGALTRDEFCAFCDESCLLLWQQARGGQAQGWQLALYDTLCELSARMAGNASVSAVSGQLAAYCGGLLFSS